MTINGAKDNLGKPMEEGAAEEEVDLLLEASDIVEQRPAPAKPFTLEKILTISARDFAETSGLDLNSYEPRGVHNAAIYDNKEIAAGKHMSDFIALVPKGAAAVVDYKIILAPHGDIRQSVTQSGTALVQKPLNKDLQTD